jgi:beta-lactamase superfamily II metal-dependent hydrolase
MLIMSFVAILSISFAPQSGSDRALEIFLIDTEGGAATLIVTHTGESLLVDSGNPGERDVARIVHVAKNVAQLTQIDHHIITHWHGDHFGGTEELAKRIPISRYYDHGPSVEPGNFDQKFAWYLKLSQGKRVVLAPGDEITLRQGDRTAPSLRLVCVCSARKVLPNKDGSQPDQDGCDKHAPQPEDTSDNAASIGFKLTYGTFDFIDCGDLTWNIEHRLVCPDNKLGVVDVYQTNHHGLANSNNPALVHAIAPRVSVMNNGPRKGGEQSVMKTLRSSPGLEAIFQVHRNVRTGDEDNAPADHIANHHEQCSGDFVKVRVDGDGKSYTVVAGTKGTPRRFSTK